MKRFLVILVLVMFFMVVPQGYCEEVSVKFGWDCNTESDLAGYYLYQRAEGHNYSYDTPSADIPCVVSNGACRVAGDVCEYEHKFTCPDNEKTVFYWVLRAYDSKGYVSGDSNEVSKVFDFAVIEPAVITAFNFNVKEKQIELTFVQGDIDRAVRWDLFLSKVAGGPYDRVASFYRPDLSDPYIVKHKITENGTYYFVLVTFTESGKYSGNSNEVNVVVDEYPVSPGNFIIIPLQ